YQDSIHSATGVFDKVGLLASYSLKDLTLNALELFIYNEQPSSSSLITKTSSSPIRDSNFSIKSNLLQPLVQNQNHLINTSELHSLSIQTPTPGMCFESWTKIEKYLDAYCSSKNFSKIIYGAEYDIAKEQHNAHSNSGCSWYINATCPKTTNLSNAIQKVKREQQIDDEAATLINHLLKCKAKDT
ncbi:20087_t:CDS:2, partial [Gigaspora rosea]